jgi:hypothetical protein
MIPRLTKRDICWAALVRRLDQTPLSLGRDDDFPKPTQRSNLMFRAFPFRAVLCGFLAGAIAFAPSMSPESLNSVKYAIDRHVGPAMVSVHHACRDFCDRLKLTNPQE